MIFISIKKIEMTVGAVQRWASDVTTTQTIVASLVDIEIQHKEKVC